MKKEIVVATAVTALLTSLSAENNIVKLDADSSGKIILNKDLKVKDIKGKDFKGKDFKGKIDANKQIGKGKDKATGFICNSCIKGKKPSIAKTPKIGKIDKHHKINQRP